MNTPVRPGAGEWGVPHLRVEIVERQPLDVASDGADDDAALGLDEVGLAQLGVGGLAEQRLARRGVLLLEVLRNRQ